MRVRYLIHATHLADEQQEDTLGISLSVLLCSALHFCLDCLLFGVPSFLRLFNCVYCVSFVRCEAAKGIHPVDDHVTWIASPGHSFVTVGCVPDIAFLLDLLRLL